MESDWGLGGASGPVALHACRSTRAPAPAAAGKARITPTARATATSRRLIVGTHQSTGLADDEDDDADGNDGIGDAPHRRLVGDHSFQHAKEHAREEAAPDAREPADEGGGERPQGD